MAMFMLRTTSGAAGNGLYTTTKYMRGVAGIGLGTTIKYLRRTMSAAANNGLGTTIKYERGWPRVASLANQHLSGNEKVPYYMHKHHHFDDVVTPNSSRPVLYVSSKSSCLGPRRASALAS